MSFPASQFSACAYDYSYVLVTGATGFIGAHVVDNLLEKGYKVRGATRSTEKGATMKAARPQYEKKLDFVTVNDFAATGVFDDGALEDIDAVVHVASVSRRATLSDEIPH